MTPQSCHCLSSGSNLGEESKEQLKSELSFAFLPQLSHVSETYVLHLEREIEVTNLKPGQVRVYDYYHPGECGTMGCQGSLGIRAWLCTKINSVSPVLLQRSRPLLIIMFPASEVGVYPTKIFYSSLPQPLYRSSSLIMFLLLLPEKSLANP